MYGWGRPAAVYASAAGTAAVQGQDEEIVSIQINTSRSLAPDMAEFFNNPLLSDIDICSEEGQRFHCHKLVLIRWSAPLRRMLTGDMLEGHQRTITIHGVDSEVLGAFLRFMYTCDCTLPTEKLVALTALADQYDTTLLTNLCMEAIRSHLANQRCCCLFYKAAKEVQQLEIQQLAWEALASNLGSLVRQHAVFVQLELEDVLLLCGRPRANAATSAARSHSSGGSGNSSTGGGESSSAAVTAGRPGSSRAAEAGCSVVFHQGVQGPPEAASGGTVRQSPPRPEYLMFLALMAWLDHKPERQQHKQQLLDCVDFDRMNNWELSQIRHHPHVQSDIQLKDMLLDAYSRRCLATSQQAVYHMQPPLLHTPWEVAGTAAGHEPGQMAQQQASPAILADVYRQQQRLLGQINEAAILMQNDIQQAAHDPAPQPAAEQADVVDAHALPGRVVEIEGVMGGTGQRFGPYYQYL